MKDKSAEAPTRIGSRGRMAQVLRIVVVIALAAVAALVAARSAPDASLNPNLFTAFHSVETYRELVDPFKPRLFSYLAARPFLDPDPATSEREGSERRFEYAGGVLTDGSFRRTVGRWTFLWMLATLAVAGLARRPWLWWGGITLGVASAYSAQPMVHPYDLPALFFATAAVVAAERGRFRGFAALLAFGTGFKETVAVFALLHFAESVNRRRQLARFAVSCALCGAVMLSIDAYSGRAPLAMESTLVEESTGVGTPKVLVNLQTAKDLGLRLVLGNAGLGLLIFVLPARRRFDGVAKVTAAAFFLGLVLFAGIGEWRIWFELLPLNLAVLAAALDLGARSRVHIPAPWQNRLRTPLGRGVLAAALGVCAYGLAAVLLWTWSHQYSRYRLSAPHEIRAVLEAAPEASPYGYHPRRDFTLRPNHRGHRHGLAEWPMWTDARGLAYLPPNEGALDLLVLGDSVAFGFGLPYGRSFPGLLKLATDARVFSGATESYSLAQTVDLFEEIDGRWDHVLLVWTPSLLVTDRFRETPGLSEPRGLGTEPPSLFDPGDLFLRLTDRLAPKPPGLSADHIPAWNPRRYGRHLELIRRLNRFDNLTVVLAYGRVQVATGDRWPQRHLKAELDREGIPTLDTWDAYGPDSFLFDGDTAHLSEKGSLALTETALRQFVARRGGR
ncbi:MAG: hypothetical protein AAGM22_10745 [Acidobacteriota bacterium]